MTTKETEDERMLANFPPMGWNSWDCYGTRVNEEEVLQNARYMAEHLKAYGWEYVVVDIQWSRPAAVNHDYAPFAPLNMDEYGRLLPAENRFPSSAGGKGFGPLAAQVHALGLKFGIHIMRGIPREAAHRHLPIEGSSCFCHEAANPDSICEWNPDMYGLKTETQAARAYEESILRLYASWGVDFIKCDDICRGYPRTRREIELISEACRDCGREIVLSLSPGPAPLQEAEHLKQYSHMWRITDDFWDRWDLLKDMFTRGKNWCVHAGPGHWPDADMLPVGALRQCDDPAAWTRFTQAEQRTLLTLWCMMRSPLMVGAELTKNDDFTLKLLTNVDVLAMEKEAFCAHPLRTTEEDSVWMSLRKDGDGLYAALFNLSDEERPVSIPLSALELPVKEKRELWTGEVSAAGEKLEATLAPHDAAVYRLR